MSGIRPGTFFVCDCGAEIIYTRPCPDAGPGDGPTCGCGAEFAPSIDDACPVEAPGQASSASTVGTRGFEAPVT